MPFSSFSRNAAAVVVALLASVRTSSAHQLDIRDGTKVAERHLQDCPTICPSGSTMGRPESTLPIFSLGSSNCSSVDRLLASQDAAACAVVGVVESVLSLSAYCGCSGVEAPSLCATCTEGGMMVDPNRTFTIEVLNATMKCQDGAALVPYISSTSACQAFTAVFNQICCGGATTVPGENTTEDPSPVAPTATLASSPSATTTPNTMSPSVVSGMSPAPTRKATSPSAVMTPSPVVVSPTAPSVTSSPIAMSPSSPSTGSSSPHVMTPSAPTSVSSSPVPNTPSSFSASDAPSDTPSYIPFGSPSSSEKPALGGDSNRTGRVPSSGRNSSSTSGAPGSYSTHTSVAAVGVLAIVSVLL